MASKKTKKQVKVAPKAAKKKEVEPYKPAKMETFTENEAMSITSVISKLRPFFGPGVQAFEEAVKGANVDKLTWDDIEEHFRNMMVPKSGKEGKHFKALAPTLQEMSTKGELTRWGYYQVIKGYGESDSNSGAVVSRWLGDCSKRALLFNPHPKSG